MLSYQHAYHVGNAGDVHKHMALAALLDYLARKDKPFTYIETHAGRGLYRLDAPEAAKTGEAAAAIDRAREAGGPAAYPGSPLIAAGLAREGDVLHLAELHPQEHAALAATMAGLAHVYREDGWAFARRILPPTPRRGLMLIDPSYELPEDYAAMPDRLALIARKWTVGVVMLW